jgi:hypothetical protein
MFKSLIFALVLALGVVTPATVPTQPVASATYNVTLDQQHATTHRIGVYDMIDGLAAEEGHCSATAVGPHALLTAQHCFADSNLVRLDNNTQPTVITSVLLDGQDHVIYIVDATFDHWADITQRNIIAREPVHIWGNPGNSPDVWRDGYYVGLEDVPMKSIKKLLGLIDEAKSVTLLKFILPIYPGDSGSGIFDASGQVIAVITYGDASAENFDYPLSFTAAQLHSIAGERGLLK